MDIGILNSFFFFYSGKIFFHISLKISRFYPRQQNPCGDKVFMVFFFSAFILLLLLFYSSFFSSNKAENTGRSISGVVYPALVLSFLPCKTEFYKHRMHMEHFIKQLLAFRDAKQNVKLLSPRPTYREEKKNCSERQLMKTWAINEHPMIVDYWRLIHIRTSPLQQNFAVLIFFCQLQPISSNIPRWNLKMKDTTSTIAALLYTQQHSISGQRSKLSGTFRPSICHSPL